MEPAFDYKQFIVLLVDDEEPALRYFKRAFGDQFRILTATSADEGLTLLRQHGSLTRISRSQQPPPKTGDFQPIAGLSWGGGRKVASLTAGTGISFGAGQ